MNMLNAGVMNGLIGAATMMNATDTSMSLYQQAKSKGNQQVMGSALGYAAASAGSAAQYAKQAEEALKQAQLEAKEQAKADQEAALEGKRAEAAAQKAAAEHQAASQPSPVDEVKISAEAQAALAIEAQPAVSEAPTAPHTTGTAQPVVKVYTPQGQFKPVSGESGTTVSVTV